MSPPIPTDYFPPTDLLAERVILVTGAGDGIGRAAATAFARHGATVVLLGRTVAKLERVYDEIRDAGLPDPAIYPMDLAGATPTDFDDLAERTEAQLGRLDGLLHNAGLLGSLTPIEQYRSEQWSQVMQVNVNAAFELTRATLPLLKSAPDASIVFTSSGVGRKGRAYWGAYSVSKFALEGLMQVLADELESSRVRVNSLNPGAVRTRMRSSAFPAEDPGSLPTPDAVLTPYLYLMGPDSAGLTGLALNAQ